MRLGHAILDSRFGRRIFGLFSLCALLPITALALISYVSVRQELLAQADTRLSDMAKSMTMGVWERLATIQEELELVALRLESDHEAAAGGTLDQTPIDPALRLTGLAIFEEGGGWVGRFGHRFSTPALTDAERRHLEVGEPLLRIELAASEQMRAWMVRDVAPPGRSPLTVWAEIEPLYLWWGSQRDNVLPARHELLILDAATGSILFGSVPASEVALTGLDTGDLDGLRGSLGVEIGGEPYLALYRKLGLSSWLLRPELTLVLTEPEALVLKPLRTFMRVFLAIVLTTFLVVALSSLRQIRKSLVPLERLQEGTRRIAKGETHTWVEVDSEDEFAELASSFNVMARNLERQFATLRSLSDVQQAVLSSLETDRIISTVLSRFSTIFPCREVSLFLLKADRGGEGWAYSRHVLPGAKRRVASAVLSPADLERLMSNRRWTDVDVKENLPGFMGATPSAAWERAVAFPIFVSDELVAVLSAALDGSPRLDAGDYDRARQLADQVAVAWSNIRLVETLDDLNWGILAALARAIDVRSHWTMGHTERVTALAIKVGRRLNLPKERLETLRRASLLHDVGKIGVRSDILDKPGDLTEEEMQMVREHVQLGVRIIEPIPALADIVPVVLQHHEWFDGKGYPAGLAGSEICLEARILSVADCYDALRSNRPYRPAVRRSEVLEFLRRSAGQQFDPQIVDVFLSTVSDPIGPLSRSRPRTGPIRIAAIRS